MKNVKKARMAGLAAVLILAGVFALRAQSKTLASTMDVYVFPAEGPGRFSAIPGRERLLRLGRAEHGHGSVPSGETIAGSAAAGRFGAGQRLDGRPRARA